MAKEALIWETQALLDSILILCKAAAGRTKSHRRPLDNDLPQTASRAAQRRLLSQPGAPLGSQCASAGGAVCVALVCVQPI